jgi:hypothetical protein
MRPAIALFALLVANLATTGTGFFVSKPRGSFAPSYRRHCLEPLFASGKVTNPSQEEATELGIREWPQQMKTGSWTEDGE